MPCPRCLYLRLLAVWLGLAMCGAHLLRAATDDDDSDKKPKKSAKTADKSDDDTPKKRRHKDSDADKDNSKSGKDSGKTASKSDKNSKQTADKPEDDSPIKRLFHRNSDSDKDTAKNGKDATKTADKSSSKDSGKTDDETPKKRRHKDSDSDKDTAKNGKDSGKTADRPDDDSSKKKKRKDADTDKETAKNGKDSDKSADKKSGKTADSSDNDSGKTTKKSPGKKGSDKSELTIPISKKGEESPKGAKDVTEQKASPTREIKTVREANEGEFEGSSKDAARSKGDDSFVNRREPGKAPSTSSMTTSRDMQGWEVVHYDDRDYVTSNSIYRFYRFADHRIEGKDVWFTSSVLIMKAVIGSQDLLINNIKFILSNPVEEVNGKILFSRLDLCKLIDPVLRPSYISGRGDVFDTVIVDAGHGGYDSGARGIYGYEKNFTLQLAELLKADLESRGLKVLMTRDDDTFISLGGRVEFANKVPNSIFVSLHFNSGQSAATGIETYALSPQGSASDYGARSVDALAFNGNQRDSENIALATAIHAAVVHHFRLVDRGVKRARWYVLTGLERPGVLFEGGFVTNNGDGQLIAAENFRRELAHTIGDAISNYRRALGR